MSSKLRADMLLVKKGLVPSREQARRLILAGKVVSGKGRVEKAGQLLPEEETLTVIEGERFVSRGGIKLDHALTRFHLEIQGKTCLDVGASTGGFTDCLLQRGASKVFAVDVGYGQFDWRLRKDPRVVLMEKTNFRYIQEGKIADPVDLAVVDVSFISLARILPKLLSFLRKGGEAVALVKPQFELSPQEVKKGVVRQPSLREKAVSKVTAEAKKTGFQILGREASPILGPKGNQEFFLHLIKSVLVILLVSMGCAHTGSTPSQPVPEEKSSAYYFILSGVEAERKKPAEALDLLDKAIKKDPENPYLWFKRATLEASGGDLKKAEEDLQKVLERDPRDPAGLILLGKIYQSQNKRKEAIEIYHKALRIDPSSEEVNTLLIESYIGEKNEQGVMQVLRDWEGKDPDNLTPLYYEAWVFQNLLKKPSKAVQVYKKILSLEPNNLKALSSLAEIYLNQKEDEKVLEVFNRMSALEPDDVSLQLKIALIYYEHKKYDRAIEKFQELLQVHPEADRLIYYLGVIYENLKREEEALAQFQKIPSASAFFKDARLHTAFLRARKGEKEEAVRLLQESIRTKPETAEFYEYLAEIYRDLSAPAQSIEILKKGLSRSPQRETLQYSLGMAYDRAGKFEDCIRSMKKVLEINPENANAMNYIGYSYADRGIRLDEALAWIQKALVLKPDDGYITDSLGWVYFRKGDLEQAERHLRRAYQLVPNETTIAEHLGDLHLAREDRDKALQFFREALALLKKQESPPAAGEDLERLQKKISNLTR